MEIGIEELAARLGDETLVVLDVRTRAEFDGASGHVCDPRQGHIAGARHLDVAELASCETIDDVHALVGMPPGAEIAAY